MRAKLTKSYVDALQPDPDPKKRLTVWDVELPAFGVTVTPPGRRSGGVKSYIVQYRLGGRGVSTRRVTIGRHGREWQPGPAREEARDILRLVRKGIDPYEERRRRAEAERTERDARRDEEEKSQRLLLPSISAEFVDRYAKRSQPRSWRNTERALADVGRLLEQKRLDRITREEIRRALDRIKLRSPSAAIEAHKALRTMYSWAVAEQIILGAAHPMLAMKPPAKANKRERVLTSAELREVWFASEQIGYPFGDLVKLLILTGLRLRECAEAVWGEFHFDQRVWIIPKTRMKRSEGDDRGDHLVPLSPLAIEFLKVLPQIEPPAGTKLKATARPLFTSNGLKPVAGFSQANGRLDRAIEEARRARAQSAGEQWDEEASVMPHWTNHDLHRTVETGLQALGVDGKIIDLLHDHRVPGASRVSRHYQFWDFYPQKEEAMGVWDRYLRGAIFSEKAFLGLVEQVDFRLLVPR
jgi:integrase